jgi:hypothetical protein
MQLRQHVGAMEWDGRGKEFEILEEVEAYVTQKTLMLKEYQYDEAWTSWRAIKRW